jgi:hypothetical protein
MNPAKLRRLSAILLLTLAFAVPTFAKRRAVTQRSPGTPFTVTISGTIRDSVTGAPINAVTISAGNREDATNAQGTFELKNTTGYGFLSLLAERSGYLSYTLKINPGDPTVLDIRLVPTATVTVHRTNGQTVQLDYESLKFGYPVPFSGYRESDFDDFCKLADGSKLAINKTQMKRLAGPATLAAAGSCCTAGNAARMSITLRSGETFDAFFTDTCEERYHVDVNARDHVSGIFVHIPITEITEIVFP